MTHCQKHHPCPECELEDQLDRDWLADAREEHEKSRRPMKLEELIAIGRYFEEARLIEKFEDYWEWSAPNCDGATGPDLYSVLDSIGGPEDEW